MGKYFDTALSDFVFDMAAGGEIRHLCKIGYTAKDIWEQLSCSMPYEKVKETVYQYLVEEGTLLEEEPGTVIKEKVTHIKEQGRYGRISFRKIVEKITEEPIYWKEISFSPTSKESLIKWLTGKVQENKQKDGTIQAYVLLDFRNMKKGDLSEGLFNVLEFNGTHLSQKNRDYLEGIGWCNKQVYHRLDNRMFGTVTGLMELGTYETTIYFINTREKAQILGKHKLT